MPNESAITSISLTSFRGVREGRVDGLVDVNVLVGRNNSGKSTVCEAMLRVVQSTTNAADRLGRDRAQRLAELRRETGPWHRDLWYRAMDGTFRLGVVFGEAEMAVIGTLKAGSIGSALEGSASQRVDIVELAKWLTCFWPSDARNADIERVLWPEILRERRDKTLTAALSTIFDMPIESMQLPPDGRLMLLFADYGLPLESQGDGARSAFRALTLLSALSKTALILEEPECHQHPGSLRRFASALVSTAKKNEVQLFITTHSTECVSAFLDASAQASVEGAVFHLDLREGALTSRKLDRETVSVLSESGTDVRSLSLYV